MLPVDSPKWTQLECDLGSAQPIADGLRDAYELLVNANGDESEISKAVDLASRQIDHIYHQQSTYSGTAAAIPHLVHFAKFGPLRKRTLILVMIAHMDFENAYDHAPKELEQAYSDAVHEARQMAVSLLETGKLSCNEAKDNLLEAVALIDRNCIYSIRDWGTGSFDCVACDGSLQAEWTESRMTVTSDAHNDLRIFLTPAKNLEKAVAQRPSLAIFFQLASTANYSEFLEWLRQYLGTFDCPYCQTQQQITNRYDWS